ncbi:MAG: LysR family transcriptional regulator, low CO2-responsive transcriptional regulator [Thermoleophilaceae bacterium]|nr:LysR family transcriptional regulator, low CO2-responsive transcriptional regulator [Thermoleophilaceae bacterium]
MTAAAQELFVTQPSVSAAVAALERELGVDLTERAGRNVRPTPAGREYARYATHVVGLLEEGSDVAARVAAGAQQHLRLGAVLTAGEHLMPSLIQNFREHRPELQISLSVANRQEVFRALSAHEVDIVVGGRAPPEADFQAVPFADNDFALVTVAGDPLAKRPWVAIEELAERSWLVRERGSGTRRLCEEYLTAQQLQPSLLTLGSNGAIKNAARIGLGVALQSRVAVQLELDLGLLEAIRPRGGLPERSWFVVWSAAGPAREPVEAFTRYVQSAAARRVLATP